MASVSQYQLRAGERGDFVFIWLHEGKQTFEHVRELFLDLIPINNIINCKYAEHAHYKYFTYVNYRYLHKLIDENDHDIGKQHHMCVYRSVLSTSNGVTAALQFIEGIIMQSTWYASTGKDSD